MSVRGRLETDVEIKASAEKFHKLLSNRPHHLLHISSDKITGCELHGGEWGKVGCVIFWNYIHDGKAQVAKEIIEAIDPDKNLVTFKVIEGDLMKEFKAIKITFHVIPKNEGSLVHVIVEYEKLHKKIAHPETLVELAAQLAEDIGSHLTQA